MEANLNESGILFVRGLDINGSTSLAKSKKSDWYWSSWLWVDDIIKETKGWNSFNFSGSEELSKLKEYRARIIAAMDQKSIVKPELFDQIFKIKLWDAQKHAASVMAASKSFYLADDVGLGKTLSAFASFALLHATGKAKTLCIVSTTSVKHQWKREIENALQPDYVNKFTFSIVEGTRTEREAKYTKDANVYICSYESLRQDYSFNGRQTIDFKNKPDCVIFDEAWKIKSPVAKVQRVLKCLFKHVPYKYALNASPVGNGYEDLFGVFDVLDPRVFLNWNLFKLRYCKFITIRPKNGKRPFTKLLGYTNVADMRKKIRHCILRRSVKDMNWASPQINVVPYWIDLTANQQRVYDSIKNSKSKGVEKTIQARVACLMSTPIDDSPKWKEFYSIIKNVIPKEKAIVFSESLTFIKSIAPLLDKQKVSYEIISGEDSSSTRELKKLGFTEGNTRILLMTAAGEAGLNLQAADIVINIDLPWNPERLRQRVGRLRPHLGGELRHIRVINILARGTIEENVVEKIQEKAGNFARFFCEQQIDFTGVFSEDNLESLL